MKSRAIWLLIVGLQLSGLTSSAEENRASGDAWTIKDGPKGTIAVEQYVDPSRAKLPLPSQKMLDDVLRRLKRVRVIDSGMDMAGEPFSGGTNVNLGEPYSGKVVFESSDPKVLKELTEYLRIREDKVFVVQIAAAPTFELTLNDGRVVNIGRITGGLIRWKAWNCDVYLMNPRGFVYWLTNHGITGPIREVQENARYKRYDEEREKRCLDEFVRTMPTSLRSFFGLIRSKSTSIEHVQKAYEKFDDKRQLKLAKSALSRQFPNESDQIGKLLEWEGKYSEHRFTYQRFPIDLLLEYDQPTVLSTVKGSTLSSAQWIGLMRYYSHQHFRRKFPSGYKPLDKTLRERIIKRVKSTGKNEQDLYEFDDALRNWNPDK